MQKACSWPSLLAQSQGSGHAGRQIGKKIQRPCRADGAQEHKNQAFHVIRGLGSETPGGFRSRREQCREPTPFCHHASFASHKAYLNSCIRGYVRTVTLDFLVSSFVTLLTVVDPMSLAPIFAMLTRGLSVTEHRRVALNACLLAGVILCGVALIGDWLLAQLGITLSAFCIAGGLLLFAVAFDMVLGRRSERESKEAEEAVHKDHAHRLAAFPLAIQVLPTCTIVAAI